MQQNPVGDNLQVYASLSTLKVEPPQNEMTKGVVPLDTLPAGWWNWLWNAVTQAQNDARYSLDTIYQEINAVLAHAGITPNPEQFDQLKQAIIKLRTQIATAVDVGSVLSTETGTNGSVKVATDGKMTVNGFGDLQQLQTLMKDTLVESINEIFNTVTTLDGELTAAEGRLDTAEGRLDTAESNIGTMTNLQTADKSSLVSAINELKTASGEGAAALEGRVDAIESNIGTLSSLDTTNKTNLVSAINEADGTANSALSKANTADTEIGTLSNLTTEDKTDLVSAINEVNAKEITLSSQISPRFTYVVDSNQALLNWANAASGNDYSAVLIRRGTWTNTKGVNLTTSGTKVVVGEAGSKLVFNEVIIGLSYNSQPSTPDYWMRDVTVECTNTAILEGSRGFQNCTNLTNCTGTGTAYGGTGFYNCTNLTNCTGTGTSTVGLGGYGFQNCTNLTNCTGTGTSNYSGNGFQSCTNLTNCTGTGIARDGGINDGNGFSECKRVSGCKKGATCSWRVFYKSYASFSENSEYLCADTPNGGFNDPTN